MDEILCGLNPAQLEAVTSTAAVLQVLAPPGSGKTKTLTARVAHLIVEKQLKPWNIIVCTFTVKAANEMKDRIRAVVGDKLAKQLLLGTFHSVALRYLKCYGQHIGLKKDFGVADSSDSKAILKRIIKQFKLSIEPGQALGRISSRKVRSNGQQDQPQRGVSTVEQQESIRLFDEYEAALAASNLLDYDDLLLRCGDLLRMRPESVSNIQAVLIDEFQDTNNVQYDLMGLFAQKWNAITIVGDPDQSIYGFRAAEIKNLHRMQIQWPDTRTINLEENYRSSGAILHAAQNIIEQDESRPQKKLQATHQYGHRPVLRRLPAASAEAEWLVAEIKRIQKMTGGLIQAGDCAILLRSSALSRVIEGALGHAGVPYRMVGGLRFYDRYEVKLIVDYLRVIHQPGNSEAVERILNVPSRKIGPETIRKLQEEARTNGTTIWSLILDVAQGNGSLKVKITDAAKKGLETFVNVILTGRKKLASAGGSESCIVEIINLISQKISLEAHLRSKESHDEKAYESRWANVEELMAQAQDLVGSAKLQDIIEADGLPVVEGLEQSTTSTEDILSIFLANIALASSAEQKADENAEPIQQVTISTIHAAKGLEWPVVFVPACYDGSIPHSRAEDNDEERRLLYVAMTRAQALLYLSCPVKSSQREETTMSSFLTQPGVARYFEEHGPSLPHEAVTSLARTLRRECPTAEAIQEAKKDIVFDEDNYWPLTGEYPLGRQLEYEERQHQQASSGFVSVRSAQVSATMQQTAQFSTASSTMQPSFTSAKARYDQVREEQEQEQLRKIDQRKLQNAASGDASKAKKRQMQGHSNIGNYFVKKSRPSDPEVRDAERQSQSTKARIDATKPLQDVSNTALVAAVPKPSVTCVPLPSHRPRTAPLLRRPAMRGASQADENTPDYIFLSSSPPREPTPRDQGNVESSKQPQREPVQGFRPASTLHTTTMSQAAPARKTYGIKRSLNGWPPKPRT